jgi:putative ABC transport system ATP-binding protein
MPLGQAIPPADALLRLVDIHKTYQMGDVAVPVLRGVDLDIARGTMAVVVGPSGSGKSTLLNLIGGIDSPTSGQVLVDGQNISAFSERELTLFRRRDVGFIFQFYNLVPTLTAEENVVVATEISDNPMRPIDALKLVGLEHRLDHFPAQMSGGEQQRVAIARAIAKNPKLLLCDEPTGALDLQTGRSVLGVLVQLNAELGKTIVLITHNSAIGHIAHRVVRIGSGTITEVEDVAERTPASAVVW